MLTALSPLPKFTSCLLQWLLGNATVAAYKKKKLFGGFLPFCTFHGF